MLWPAFTAASTDPLRARLVAQQALQDGRGCVVFKVHAQRARPIGDLKHHSFEGDLLFQPAATLRVKALREPTLHNLRQGTPDATGDFCCSTGGLASRRLSFDEAKERTQVLVELYEEDGIPDAVVVRAPALA